MNRLNALQHRQNAGVPLYTSGLLQRKCDCGNHTVAGGECSACSRKGDRMVQRSAIKGEHADSRDSDVPSVVHEVLRSAGQPLDTATRAFMEPRFGHDFGRVRASTVAGKAQSGLTVTQPGDTHEQEADRMSERIPGMSSPEAGGDRHDFSQVRVHADPEAAESARSINALAYTVGRDIVFAAGKYAPETTVGRSLLSHELTHVLQQSNQTAALVQRAPEDQKDSLEEYVKFLSTQKKIEAKSDSKKKALTLIELELKDETGPALADSDRYLLILELAAGKPDKAHLDGIIEVLERTGNYELVKLFGPGRVSPDVLVALFVGNDKARLEDFFNRRFEGGLTQVKAGKIKPAGDYVPRGVPLSSIEFIKQTVTWLKTHKKPAGPFFSDAWGKNKIVLLGEAHFDDVQREFAADMLAANGGKDVGLALEIHVSLQEEVNYYIEHGQPPKGAKGWWINDALFKKLLDSAKATKTQVIAMDTNTSTDRDKHMAEEVIKLAKSKSKILVYVGGMHIKEANNAALGEKLAAKFGGNSYAISISHATFPDNIYFMIKAALPQEKSLGFDIDESPLANYPDPEATTKPGMSKTLDGYIYFSSPTAYK